MGMSDSLRKSRVKVFCPKCEEVYVPLERLDLDGAFFGPSLPHIFLAHYRVVLPPQVFSYVPKLFGFKIAGKRSSHFFKPCESAVLSTADTNLALKSAMAPQQIQAWGKEERKQNTKNNNRHQRGKNKKEHI